MLCAIIPKDNSSAPNPTLRSRDTDTDNNADGRQEHNTTILIKWGHRNGERHCKQYILTEIDRSVSSYSLTRLLHLPTLIVSSTSSWSSPPHCRSSQSSGKLSLYTYTICIVYISSIAGYIYMQCRHWHLGCRSPTPSWLAYVFGKNLRQS